MHSLMRDTPDARLGGGRARPDFPPARRGKAPFVTARLDALMVEAGLDHFASGWLWLVADGDELMLLSAHDAQTPVIEEGLKPLLVLDLWERLRAG